MSANMNEPLLRVSNLSKYYGSRIGCADVSFELWPGEVLAIVGEIRFRQDDTAQHASRPD
jgi:ABC-type phosphonate transport system ATPase subunit